MHRWPSFVRLTVMLCGRVLTSGHSASTRGGYASQESQGMLRIGGQKVPNRLILLVATDSGLIAFGLLLAIVARLGFSGTVASYLGTWQTLFRFLMAILVCEI